MKNMIERKCFLSVLWISLFLSSGIPAAGAGDQHSTRPVAAEKQETEEAARGDEQDPKEPAVQGEEVESYEPGTPYSPEGSYFFGYRFVSQEDSPKAGEYVYPNSSLTFGLDLIAAPLPFRYHLIGEYLSQYDFYADTGFAYKDMILFRDILVGTHHFMDYYDYALPGAPPGLLYRDLTPYDDYYVNFLSNQTLLRLKAPEYPFHTFFKHKLVERNGRIKQRFLAYGTEELILASEARDIDWRSNTYILGANSHIGPIEIEYAYDRADFDPNGNSILYDYYAPSADQSRPGDVFAHNVIPDTDSAAHTVKVHSSYTGGLVAAATLTNLDQQNNFSQAASTTWKGAVDVTWVPDPVIGFFLKYRHRDVDMDTPDIATLPGLDHTLRYTVREGVSYDKDSLSLSARYRPLDWLSLLPFYSYTRISRENIDQWEVLKENSAVHTINLTARARPLAKLKLKALYEYRHYDDPSYNTEPDNSNKLRLTATYFPVSWLNLYMDYQLTLTDRDDLRYLSNSPFDLLEGWERSGRRDHLLASISAAVSPKFSVTASWSYNRWDVEQDLAYGKRNGTGGGDLPFIDSAVPYTDEANSLSLGLHYLPRQDITVTADATYTLSQGEFVPGMVLDGAASGIISHTNLKADETIFSIGISKTLPRNWEIGLKFYTDIYNDDNDKTDDLLDGELFITTLSLKRYF